MAGEEARGGMASERRDKSRPGGGERLRKYIKSEGGGGCLIVNRRKGSKHKTNKTIRASPSYAANRGSKSTKKTNRSIITKSSDCSHPPSSTPRGTMSRGGAPASSTPVVIEISLTGEDEFPREGLPVGGGVFFCSFVWGTGDGGESDNDKRLRKNRMCSTRISG